MKKIIPIILVAALALSFLLLTGCGETLDQTTTDGLNLGETVESGLDEALTDMSEELTDMSDKMTENADDESVKNTDEALDADTTVSAETER